MKLSAAELYNIIVRKNNAKEEITCEDVMQLFRVMKEELMICGKSHCLNLFYNALTKNKSWKLKTPPKSYTIVVVNSNVPQHTAAVLLKYFASFLEGYDISEAIEKIRKKLFDSSNKKNVVECKKFFVRIDEALLIEKTKMYEQFMAAQGDEAAAKTETAAQDEAQDGVTMEKRRAICLRDTLPVRIADAKTEQASMDEQFIIIRNQLLQANQTMKQMEDYVVEMATRKAYTRLIELYNLIADTKDSTFRIAEETGNADVENAAYNLEVFLDMISEYLADYGIETIMDTEGAPLRVKYHTVLHADRDYNPNHSVIDRGIRNGFVWGDQVIQKQKVTLK